MNLCCLKCTEVMDRSRIDDIEVDHCSRCGGLWLDHGEVERLSKKMASDIDRLRKLVSAKPGPPPVPTEVEALCPACTSAMKEVPLGAIHIDFCTRCKGIFLDRGELDAALAVLKDSKATIVALIATAAAEAPTESE
jgi:Zn-finger nucleic acid-binding protein